MKKGQRDAIVLGVLLVVLVVVAVYILKPMSTPPPPPKPAQPADNGQAATTPGKPAVKTAEGLEWIKTDQLSAMASIVENGRDPFRDLLAEADEPPPLPAPVPTGNPPMGGGTLPGFGDVIPPVTPLAQSFTRTLQWTSLAEIRREVADLPSVKVKPGKGLKQVVITGEGEEFSEALGRIDALDAPPPVPAFVLAGVISTEGGRYASISLDGRYFTLAKGQAVPNTGWTITEITPNTVVLTDGKRPVLIRLSGGTR